MSIISLLFTSIYDLESWLSSSICWFEILSNYKNNFDNLIDFIDNQKINEYVNFIQDQLFAANKYFNDQEPWKKKADQERLNTIVYVSLELIRKISILLYPIIPATTLKVLDIFQIKEDDIEFNSIKNDLILKSDSKIKKISILFKKIEKNDWFTLSLRSTTINWWFK